MPPRGTINPDAFQRIVEATRSPVGDRPAFGWGGQQSIRRMTAAAESARRIRAALDDLEREVERARGAIAR
jgi:hypothetical protein